MKQTVHRQCVMLLLRSGFLMIGLLLLLRSALADEPPQPMFSKVSSVSNPVGTVVERIGLCIRPE